MKFRITRTSTGPEKPTAGAYEEPVEYLRTDGIRVSDKWWVIELNSLDDLLALAAKEGNDLIIGGLPHMGVGFQIPGIEIYDDHKE